MIYRKEIDGLRAISVIPVILYHAGFNFLNGGFLGVDVFFVISGYLITQILKDELINNNFNILLFYQRRAKRIFPSLFFVMSACIPFSWFYLSGEAFNSFSISLISATLFFSNIFFSMHTGYFDQAAELNPLLHTWSLGVEEQFYLIFPVFLYWTRRLSFNKLLIIISVIASISFIHAFHSSDFYMAHTRAWELLAGSIAALLTKNLEFRKNNLLSLVGLFAIIFAMILFNPDYYNIIIFQIVTVLGAVLIILFARENTIVNSILSTRALSSIGLISYSSYLWHQPIFSFAKIILIQPSVFIMGGLSVASLALGALTTKYIETPVRTRFKFSNLRILIFIALFFSIYGALAQNLRIASYKEKEKLIIQSKIAGHKFFSESAYDIYGCFMGEDQTADNLLKLNCVHASENRRIILFGDSEAAHYLVGLKANQSLLRAEIMQFTGTSCRAMIFSGNNVRCEYFYNAFTNNILPILNENDTIIIASNWWKTHEKIGDSKFRSAITKTLQDLSISKAKLIVIGNAPGFITDPFDNALLYSLRGSDNSNIYLPSQNYKKSDEIIKEVSENFGIKYFLPALFLCPEFELCLFRDSNEYLYFDSSHYSYYGSLVVVQEILRKIKDI